jgi:hypothetical protein
VTKKPTLTSKLGALSDKAEYKERGAPAVRWGQILRTTPTAAKLMATAETAGRAVPIRSVARVRSGLVTRANAYFLVRELGFDEIPQRFRLTKSDYRTRTVIVDGMGTAYSIPRRHLLPALKGPEALRGPEVVTDSDLRVVNITQSPDELRDAKDNETIQYIRRGETATYSTSTADKLKGGIPSQRSNIKSRKPHWYSLNVPQSTMGRLVIPEHFDQRFLTTALTEAAEGLVVIDKLFVVIPDDLANRPPLCAAMNSLLTWYQLELRGRTQLGEGVLEVKIPDIAGTLVLDPSLLTIKDAQRLADAFAPIAKRPTGTVTEELQLDDRAEFDRVYLQLIGVKASDVEDVRTVLARELREAMAERRTRAESVADQKAQRTPKQRVSRAVDAFAARIVTSIDPYPDPRHYITVIAMTEPVAIHPFEGQMTLGEDLFDQGTVFAGTEVVAKTRDIEAARWVRAVLTLDPAQTVVDVPDIDSVKRALESWTVEIDRWWIEFTASRLSVVAQITDERTVQAVTLRALQLAHASEIPANALVEDFAPPARQARKSRRR